MKNILYGLLLLAFSCNPSVSSDQDVEKELPRIAIAGFAIESSTFSPAFTRFHPLLPARKPFMPGRETMFFPFTLSCRPIL